MPEQSLKLPKKFVQAIHLVVAEGLADDLTALRDALEPLREPEETEPQPDEGRLLLEELRHREESLQRLSRRARRLRRRLRQTLGAARRRLPVAPAPEPEPGPTPAQIRAQKLAEQADSLAGQVDQTLHRLQEMEPKLKRSSQNLKRRLEKFCERAELLIEANTPPPQPARDPLSRQALLDLPDHSDTSIGELAGLFFRHQADLLFLKPGHPPQVRSQDQVFPLPRPNLSAAALFRMAMLYLTRNEREQLVRERRLRLLRCQQSQSYLVDLFFDRGELNLMLQKQAAPERLSSLPEGWEKWLGLGSGLLLISSPDAEQRQALAYSLLERFARHKLQRIFVVEAEPAFQLEAGPSQVLQFRRHQDFTSLAQLGRLRPNIVYLDRVENDLEYSQISHWAGQDVLVLLGSPASTLADCLQTFLHHPLAEFASILRAVVGWREEGAFQVLSNDASVTSALSRADLSGLREHLETSGSFEESAEELERQPVLGWT
ncbi:MAG: hypothetical protein U0931_21060 [Vulcanimicrobiota bacterium]